ncbi:MULTISPECIES: metalloregulator ArsR/SmtB family transcription factor [Pseudoxanthomonas]|jgi:DNA-binding transcriptional ArsR family regulator|uniref:ArsR/SmtB family transcription factor n=1 Tax=Pseudoxanthomonas TaxID=83618 RepID=UPI00114487E4|nr:MULTISPECIES: metalloregulator ArsR/SmtB family transcription factor [Pseudoxanthomonas]MBB3274516.1 DNA-binding transcriptional ArsR family regulator [Pseudoxanthomonas sp. OG2]MBD9378191.1 winged helix-turn-helix transcriptional regulator [Pseudoxanthomonas sp. PXM04]
MAAQASERLDALFHALADDSRRRMVDQLSQGPASVSELARPLDLAMPSVVKHLAVLERGGLVASEKQGRVRTFRLIPGALAQVEAWAAQRERSWRRRFDRLEAFLARTGSDDADSSR